MTDYLLLRDRTTPPSNVKSERLRYSFTGYPRFLDNEGYPASKPPWGTLNCLDLLFCSGTRDSKIRAFDKETGAELWSGNLPWVGSAPPTTYSINGRQFVVVASTGNKLGQQIEYGDAYVAFALPETK